MYPLAADGGVGGGVVASSAVGLGRADLVVGVVFGVAVWGVGR